MNSLTTLLTSSVRSRLVEWIVSHAGDDIGISTFARQNGFTARAVVKEVENLESLEVLTRRRVGREDRLSANPRSGVLRALSELVQELGNLKNAHVGDDEVVRNALVAWGAPLVRTTTADESSPEMLLEEAIISGLDVGKRDATLLRSLPVALVKNRQHLDLDVLVELARERRLAPELGMLLELTGRLAGWPALSQCTEKLRDGRRTKNRFFFQPRNRFEERAIREQTPEFARRWGFWLNMDTEMFRSTMKQHAAVH